MLAFRYSLKEMSINNAPMDRKQFGLEQASTSTSLKVDDIKQGKKVGHNFKMVHILTATMWSSNDEEYGKHSERGRS